MGIDRINDDSVQRVVGREFQVGKSFEFEGRGTFFYAGKVLDDVSDFELCDSFLQRGPSGDILEFRLGPLITVDGSTVKISKDLSPYKHTRESEGYERLNRKYEKITRSNE